MSVELITEPQRYIGLSTDDWHENAPEGSTLHLVDTGETYIFHNGMWEYDLRLITALGMAS